MIEDITQRKRAEQELIAPVRALRTSRRATTR